MPDFGTFLTADPVLGVIGGPASTFNPYSYVRGNTVNLTDPSGEFVPFILGAIIAGAIGSAIGGAIYSLGSQIIENIKNGMNLTEAFNNICQDKLAKDVLSGMLLGAVLQYIRQNF